MRIKAVHPSFIMPTKGSEDSGAFDLYMPEPGIATGREQKVALGFCGEIPPGHIALLLPRSSIGAKYGLELNNTCGVIDSDYRGEWMAVLRTKSGTGYWWERGDRLLQFLVIPVARVSLERVDSLDNTQRGSGGFGSSGK